MRIGPYTTHPASGTGQFSKLYPHTVYTLCIILIYIYVMYYIKLAQTKHAARPKPKKWKSEAQKQSQTVASLF